MMKKRQSRDALIRELPLYYMLIPAIVLVLIYCYGPMAGIIMAFQNFTLGGGWFGSKWIGMQNFVRLFTMPGIVQVIRNTVLISVSKMIGGIVVPVVFALLLNEVKQKSWKRTIQTMVYLPNFLSWVILSGVLIDILSPSHGFVNQMLGMVGIAPIFFLGNKSWFPVTMVISDIWKNFGFSSVIYLASLTGIDPALYESALIDGANRWKQTLHITLPGISSIVVLMTVLSLASVLNGGFDQIYNMYNPSVMATGDILDTLVYRLGLYNYQFSLATAAGLFKSLVSLVFIAASYYLADKWAGYRIF
jgi:putative aldouronate transport system permease protein